MGFNAASGSMISIFGFLEVKYICKLKDGTVVEEAMTSDRLFQFRLGCQEVIAGWDKAIPNMSMGEKATLEVTSDLAYGPEVTALPLFCVALMCLFCECC